MADKHRRTYTCLKALLVLVGVVCISILGKAVYLKVIRGEHYKQILEKNYSQSEVKIPATRGDILARDGRKLACSVPNYRVTMDPCADGLPDSVFNRDIGELSLQLSNLFRDKSPEEYRNRITQARLRGKRYITLGNRRISHPERNRVKSFAIFRRGRNKGGLFLEEGDERKMPFGILAARTVGKLYDDKELGGMVGLENAYNKTLRGEDGISNRIRMAGSWENIEKVAPKNGRSLVTTIDIDIQDVAENSLMSQLRNLDADHGVAMLMEVKTGAMRAIVNLHRTSSGSYVEDFNYAVGELVEPGSTFKLASLIACLDDGKVALDDTIDTYDGEFKIYDRIMRDTKADGHGNITIKKAFEVSSNIGISRMVMKSYDNDKQKFIDHIRDLGLCDSLAIDIKGEKPTDMKKPGDEGWSGISLPWMSIGYEIRLTPLQLLTFYNAVANNGTMMRPMFVECELDGSDRVNVRRPSVMRNSIATTRTIRAVQEALKGVVESGTASNIKSTPYKIAGKTGTAQIANGSQGYVHDGERSYLASFAGYFPADNPLYSCVVMVFSPAGQIYGNKAAGTVVKDIADRVYAAEFRKGAGKVEPEPPSSGKMPMSKGGWAPDLVKVLSELRVPYSVNTSTDWVSANAKPEGVNVSARHFVKDMMPNVYGMGAADAVSLLESMGLRVAIEGAGRVVSQSIASDAHFKPGDMVRLTLSDE